MRNSPFWWLFIVFMVLLDLYVFQALKVVMAPAAARARMIVFSGYWILSALAIIALIALPYLNIEGQSRTVRSTIFAMVMGIFFAKVIAALFFLIDDVRRGVQWIAGKFMFRGSEGESVATGEGISRSVFLSWTGFIFGTGLFGSLIYGFGNKYKYQVKKIGLDYANLPPAFRGLKIVHISDIHAGSFNNKAAVERGIDKILEQKPDLILFTGDLVNDRASEMEDYIDTFSRLKAPLGVYSTLGNHDYGDYAPWDSMDEKRANLDRLKAIHAEMGWRLLVNENVILEKNGEQIALIGIENWSSKARFPKYGDMKKAYQGTENIPFKILMSHDPSHWDAEVRTSYKDVDLMLAGHTHGMQFGVEVPGFKWSPVQYVYHQWAGLYEEDKQKLYINRGFGFIGYPGRVGILPEITVLNLG